MWTTAHRRWKQQREQQWQAAVKAMSRNWTTQPPHWDGLLSLCSKLIVEDRYELAVIVAQMACEIIVEQTLTPLLKGRKAPRVYNVQRSETRKLYKHLTHDQSTLRTSGQPTRPTPTDGTRSYIMDAKLTRPRRGSPSSPLDNSSCT